VAPMPVPEKTVDVPATVPAKKKPSPSSKDKRGRAHPPLLRPPRGPSPRSRVAS
jgi:hypothetical protein